MAAPTVIQESEILSRLEQMLGETDETPETNENSRTTKAPAKVPPPAVAETPEAVIEPDEPEDVAAQEEEPAEPEEADALETPDEDAIHTVSDLARMFEVEESELLEHLQVDAGDGQSVSLGKVISNYKSAPEAARKLDELKIKEQKFESEASELRAKTDQHVRELAVHTQTLLDMTQAEFANVDWKRLEVEEPTQYIIMKQKQAERTQLIHTAIEKLRSVEQDRAVQTNKQTQEFRRGEIEKLAVKMPEWSKAEVAQAAMNETRVFLEGSGFSAQEINSISDHRYLLVAYEAAQYRKLKNQAPKKLEKLRSLPKPKAVLRSTARRDSGLDTQRKAQKKLDRLKQTGDERDAARIFEELL